MTPRCRSSRRRAQRSTARIRTTETTTRSSARCSPSAVAASARPCTTSSTAPRRSALAHHATDIAVAGASQIKVRTGTRRFTRSAIVCAASRLSGTSNTRSNALCGPRGQTAGARAATAIQITQKAPPTDSREFTSSTRAVRTARMAPKRPRGRVTGASSMRRPGRVRSRSASRRSGGTRRAAMACQPCAADHQDEPGQRDGHRDGRGRQAAEAAGVVVPGEPGPPSPLPGSRPGAGRRGLAGAEVELVQQDDGEDDQGQAAHRQERQAHGQAAGEGHGGGSGPGRGPQRLTDDPLVPAVGQEHRQHAAERQGAGGRLLHPQQQVLVEAHEDGGRQAEPRAAPEPPVQVHEHHGQAAGDVAGQDAGHRVAVALEPEEGRLDPGVQRRLERHGAVRRRLLDRLDRVGRRHLVEHQAVEHGQAPQPPERTRRRQVPGVQGHQAGQDGDQDHQREDHRRPRRRAEQRPGRRRLRAVPRPVPTPIGAPGRRRLDPPSRCPIRIHATRPPRTSGSMPTP